MGCVSSKPDINDQHPNIFQVSNMNDQGELINPGQIEVTENELVLYQRNKQPTIWPLRSLRKYGFDSEIFSFECGRRCPTGEGIYAFRCHRAEQLFNIVQQHIVRNSDDNPHNSVISPSTGDFPIPAVSTGPPVQRRVPEGYLNPVSLSNSVRVHPSLSRPGSVISNGPVSPPVLSPPPLITPEEHNNNLIAEHSYTNTFGIVETMEAAQANYENLGIGALTSPVVACNENNMGAAIESPCHLYMNVDTSATKEEPEDDVRHCYANIDTKDNLRPLFNHETPLSSVPQTPTSLYLTIYEVNYAELDLDPGKGEAPTTSQLTPESPKGKKSYATIDFQRTNALSQSTNPRMEVEEGSRKTRHNSTISDVPARHSNSLSD